MTWQTTASLAAALAFGVIMAATSPASGEINRGGGLNDEGRCPTQAEAACYHGCATAGSTPEQVATCRASCHYPDKLPPDPLDCQFLRRPVTVAPNTAGHRPVLRQPN
ncbi:MAG: hypothetical protein QM759_15400 [Terricaulis sp.]